MVPPILYMQDFSPPVRAVFLTAEAIGLQLDKIEIDLSKKEHHSESYDKINPQHTIPTLDDNGIILWDSHAINAYLVEKYAKEDSLYPKDLIKRAQVDQRLHFDSGVIFSWLRYISRGCKLKGRTSLTDDQIEALNEGYQLLNTFLRDNKWVAGDSITIADFSLLTNISSLNLLYPVKPETYPNVIRWLEQAETLPYYKLNKKGLEDLKKMLKPLLSK